MPKRRRSRSLAREGTLAAAAKRRRRQEVVQQRDSRLALARLAHSLAINLQVPLWCMPCKSVLVSRIVFLSATATVIQ